MSYDDDGTVNVHWTVHSHHNFPCVFPKYIGLDFDDGRYKRLKSEKTEKAEITESWKVTIWWVTHIKESKMWVVWCYSKLQLWAIRGSSSVMGVSSLS